MPKCGFNKVAKQLYWNHISAWVFSCKFAAFFQNTFFHIYFKGILYKYNSLLKSWNFWSGHFPEIFSTAAYSFTF